MIYWPLKAVVKVGNGKLINAIFSRRICMATLRFLKPTERSKISCSLKSYNTLDQDSCESGAQVDARIEKLKRDGYCGLGTVFTETECAEFRASLEGELCYDSQVPMQSSGTPFPFESDGEGNQKGDVSYIVFMPQTTLAYDPLRRFLIQPDLKKVIDGYLRFPSEVYACQTWVNPECPKAHYVHRVHRDYDDYRSLTLVIFWNRVGRSNGALSFIPKSHESESVNGRSVLLGGDPGEAYLIDFFGLHAGNSISQGSRYSSWIRYGKRMNHASIMEGGSITPTCEQLRVE